jgi:hypothetical protein
MTGSIALDVVIGLVFIYTLYSLLTTTVTEMLASAFQLRAKFLEKGISRMLDDDSNTTTFSQKFYNQPLIKYLASNKKSKPSYLSAGSFSKNLVDLLKHEAAQAPERKTAMLKELKASINNIVSKCEASVQPKLANLIALIDRALSTATAVEHEQSFIAIENEIASLAHLQISETLDEVRKILYQGKNTMQTLAALRSGDLVTKINHALTDPQSAIATSETASFIRSLLEDAQQDVEKFRANLEQWYDDTMERVSGWYKKRIQLITFAMGFLIAGIFNVDTIGIVRKLSHDPEARAQYVAMAEKLAANETLAKKVYGDTTGHAAFDSLQSAVVELHQQAKEAENVVALAGPTSWKSLIGWLLTAIALSLGAPFWFDLLNKLVKLRSSVQPSTTADSPKDATNNNAVPVLKRVG